MRHLIAILFLIHLCSRLSAQTSIIGGIINNYTPVNSLNSCNNKLTVSDASFLTTGDTILIIQMKGAEIDSSNSPAFGRINLYSNSGNYEINFVKSISGNVVELKNQLTRQYHFATGKVQLVRVPYYQNAIVTSSLTCLAWDGSKGGVLVFNVAGSLTLNAPIDVSGKGFLGGVNPLSTQATYNCYENQFYYPPDPTLSSSKGEGIATISVSKSYGKGALANGGGSGNSHNSGAAGGSNFGTGGHGGYNYEGPPCNTSIPFDNGGIGGYPLSYTNAANKIFLGGGGGAGHTNSGVFQGNGGNGGGIVILFANSLKSNGQKIISNGIDGKPCGNTGPNCHEGMGGGGAGGTVLAQVTTFNDPALIEVKGGKGADMTAINLDKIGPGGGGGGGVVWLTSASQPAALTGAVNGGASGVCTDHSNNPWGATAGQNGSMLFSWQPPIDLNPFKANIDSVRIKERLRACNSFDFDGFGYTNANPVVTWQWYFGDGGTANTQNTSHTYLAAGSYTVKLVVTDANGCKDSIPLTVNASFLTMDAGPADTVCQNGSTILQATSSGAVSYSWTPTAPLNNPTVLNPTATITATTMFYLTATNAQGCSIVDSVKIQMRPAPVFSLNPALNVCKGDPIQLNASGGQLYSWTPSSSLNNSTIPNPVATPAGTTNYNVQITDTLCHLIGNLSTTVTVLNLPTVTASKSNDIDCSASQSQLSASGALNYSWSPGGVLNNPFIANPIATPTVTTQFNVTGTDASGCKNTANVMIYVSSANNSNYKMASAFTPNNDGRNDCFGIKLWGAVIEVDFNIYNRWGQLVFHSNNPTACWDGTFRGQLQDSDIFVYTVKAKTACQPEVFRKGTVALIR